MIYANWLPLDKKNKYFDFDDKFKYMCSNCYCAVEAIYDICPFCKAYMRAKFIKQKE